VVDHGDFVVKDRRIVLVPENPFLKDRLVVEMERQAGCVVSTGAFERASDFNFQHVIDAVVVLINPSPDRVARISRLEVAGPVTCIGIDPTVGI
jgi:hypothetical protein